MSVTPYSFLIANCRHCVQLVERSVSTVSRLLARLGVSSLQALEPVRPIVRYEHVAPGEMLHIDTKKLGRIVRPSHRVTGDRRDSVEGAGSPGLSSRKRSPDGLDRLH